MIPPRPRQHDRMVSMRMLCVMYISHLSAVMMMCGIVTLIPTGAFFGDFGSAGRCLAAGLLMMCVSEVSHDGT